MTNTHIALLLCMVVPINEMRALTTFLTIMSWARIYLCTHDRNSHNNDILQLVQLALALVQVLNRMWTIDFDMISKVT